MINAFFSFLVVVIVFGGAYVWLRDRSTALPEKNDSAQTVVLNTQTSQETADAETSAPSASGAPQTEMAREKNSTAATTITRLTTEMMRAGSGDRETKKGDTISVHYTGTLLDGTKFDSSVDRGEPFTFTLGAGNVIRGWDEGLVGMKVGEKRKLTIPADMAYGSQSMGKIPANSPLVFEVELLTIQ